VSTSSAASFRTEHRGAGPRRKLPRRLDPRRTHKIMGLVRVTPRQHEGYLGGLAASVLLVGCSDLPQQFANWLLGV
jgi:hypothetical protein